MLSHIKIVLVETTHPGNIGAVARAMKNMMMTNLCLVSPKFFPHADATSRSAGADDILMQAHVFNTLEEAIADCSLVIGASARRRTIQWDEITPRECAEKIFIQETTHEKIALVFGRESSGLKNHELDLCRFLLHIPCNPDYSSLNVAAAVQVVAYELLVTAQNQLSKNGVLSELEAPLATAKQMESFYQHLHETLNDIGFLQTNSKSVLRRLRRIYNRIQLDTKELDILRGILRLSQGHKKSS